MFSPSRPKVSEAEYLEAQRQRLAEVQRNRQILEEDIYRRTHTIQQQQLQKWEEKRQREQKALDHLSQDVYNSYNGNLGRERSSPDVGIDVRSGSSPRPRVLEDVISSRNKEHARKREEYTLHIRQLNKERERLIAESEKMSEKMRTLKEETGSEGSSGGRQRDVVPIIPGNVVQSVPSYISDVKNRLPDTEDRLLRLKQELERRRRQLYAPYNGELDIHSYQNWQLPHYHMVRSIVDETVNRFLDMYFRAAIPTTNITAARAMMDEQSKELSRTRNYLAVQVVADDALQEIMEEAVHEECTRVAEEYKQTAEMIRVMTANMIMKQIEIVTTGVPEGRGEDDPAYNMVTKAFYRIKKNRDKYRKEIWGHSQNITVKGKANVQSAPEEDDVTILKFHNIVPVNLKNVTPIDSESDAERAVKRALIGYQNVESLYWKTKVADVNVTHLSKKCHGIYSAKLSKIRNLLAVGTGHGDIIVYDIRRDVMKPVRAVRNESVEDSVVVDISWSVTGRRLVTVDKKGAVKVWSMTPGELSRTGLKALELQADAEMFVPPPLTLLAKLQADSRDFNFTAGTLFEMDIQKGRQGPVLADFYPAVSLMGSQSQVCVALRSGDILKCHLESMITGADAELQHVPNILQEKIPVEEEEEKSTIGQGVPGELLHQHRRPLIHMCFIETIKNMVTVDQAGYINVWRYSRRQFSEFHWFTPYRKYKMMLSKREYVPVPNVKSEVIFTDMQTQHRKTRQEIARERENAEEQIKSLNLGNPWYSDSSDKDRVKLVYPVSKDILDSEAGGMFHIIIKHTNTNLLSTYGTRRYKPVMVNCTKLLHCKSSPDGTLMVFVLLFPAFKTKAPHLTVISLDLMTMTVQDVRLNVPLTDDQYRKCQTGDAVHCFITDRHNVTQSPYLCLVLSGSLTVYSMTSGTPVLLTEGADSNLSDFTGFSLQSRLLQNVSSNAQLLVSMWKDYASIVFYSKTLGTLTRLFLNSNSDEERDREVLEAWKNWKRLKPSREEEPTVGRVTPMSRSESPPLSADNHEPFRQPTQASGTVQAVQETPT